MLLFIFYVGTRQIINLLLLVLAEIYPVCSITRSFNHIGPRQKDVFVVASFARKLIDIQKRKTISNELTTGDLNIIRDFVDVRDVVRAYYLLFKNGTSGEVYNICSGNGTSLSELLEKMRKLAGVEIIQKVDSSFVRPDENRVVIGSNEKIKKEVGWSIRISLDTSLKDILKYYADLY